jgi:hypothetical protein
LTASNQCENLYVCQWQVFMTVACSVAFDRPEALEQILGLLRF